MNRYPLWKYLLVLVVVLVGLVYALPNIYGDSPAVQIRARTAALDETLTQQVKEVLEEARIESFTVYLEQETLVLRFEQLEDQLRAKDALSIALGNRYTVALNLVPATPEWLRSFAAPMFLGLDLRGGVHFLMQVDMASAESQALERYVGDFRTYLRESKIRYRGVKYDEGKLEVRFADEQTRDQGLETLSREYRELDLTTAENERAWYIYAQLNENALREEQRSALQQNIT